ncbi:MAG: hypothetical protein HGA38_00310 [Candidatus Moranbacteria bacterium]|nr:hypothetical protein [Candidatus Moranbacteria bacterium]NTW45978.1 hypothetical protein [Candidatus Moranbacteria bacterium]
MRIDIVPEGNKTKRESQPENDYGLPFIFDTVFGGVKHLLESVVSSVADMVDEALGMALRRAFAVILGVFGIWFLFSGFAKLLDYLYGAPGVGEVIVGALVFMSAIIVSAFARRSR